MPRRRPQTLLVGVTGGIGSGKTLACSAFERAGVSVLYADDIAKRLYATNASLRREITKLLGRRAYGADGSLDRAYVASQIFSRVPLQQKINAIVHPRVRREIRRAAARLARAGNRLVIVEAALIFESGMNRVLDYVIVVDAPRAERIRRIVRRDKVSRSHAERRMRAQWDTRTKRRLADVVLDNSGSARDLRRAVKLLVTLFSRISGS